MLDKQDCQKGFTLIEIMIALFIFAIVTTLSLIGLKNVVDSQQIIDTHVAQMHELELSQLILQRDFEQIIDRTIIDQNNQLQPSIYGNNNYIEFTRAGYINPLAMEDRSELQRVAYYIKNNQLIRRSWAQLDRTQNTPTIDKVLINNVLKIQIRYLDDKGVFHDQWPLQGTNIVPRTLTANQQGSTNQSNPNQQQSQTAPGANNTNQQQAQITSNANNPNQQQTQANNPNQPPPPPMIPKAVELIMTIDRLGQLDRLFAIPGVGLNG